MRDASESTHLVTGTFADPESAEHAVGRLIESGYGRDEIVVEEGTQITVGVRPRRGDESRVGEFLGIVPAVGESFEPPTQ